METRSSIYRRLIHFSSQWWILFKERKTQQQTSKSSCISKTANYTEYLRQQSIKQCKRFWKSEIKTRNNFSHTQWLWKRSCRQKVRSSRKSAENHHGCQIQGIFLVNSPQIEHRMTILFSERLMGKCWSCP